MTTRNNETRTRSGLPAVAPKAYRHDGADLAERRARVFELRKLRWSFRRIAAELGISPSRAHEDYQQAMHDLLPVEDVEEMRRADLDLLDSLIGIEVDRIRRAEDYPLPTDPIELGRVLAIDVEKANTTLMRLMERRAKLAGLDRPVETVLEVAGTVMISAPEQVSQMRDQLAERRARAS